MAETIVNQCVKQLSRLGSIVLATLKGAPSLLLILLAALLLKALISDLFYSAFDLAENGIHHHIRDVTLTDGYSREYVKFIEFISWDRGSAYDFRHLLSDIGLSYLYLALILFFVLTTEGKLERNRGKMLSDLKRAFQQPFLTIAFAVPVAIVIDYVSEIQLQGGFIFALLKFYILPTTVYFLCSFGLYVAHCNSEKLFAILKSISRHLYSSPLQTIWCLLIAASIYFLSRAAAQSSGLFDWTYTFPIKSVHYYVFEWHNLFGLAASCTVAILMLRNSRKPANRTTHN